MRSDRVERLMANWAQREFVESQGLGVGLAAGAAGIGQRVRLPGQLNRLNRRTKVLINLSPGVDVGPTIDLTAGHAERTSSGCDNFSMHQLIWTNPILVHVDDST